MKILAALKRKAVMSLILIVAACTNAEHNKAIETTESAPAMEPSPNAAGVAEDKVPSPLSSSAAGVHGNDSTRKMIRTARLKFRAKNVMKSTTFIEDIVNRNGGFVSQTDLKTNVQFSNTTPLSADSSLESITYIVENRMVLRVPDYNLDTTLRLIAAAVDFLDYRTIQAEDVTLRLLANEMSRNRSRRTTDRLEKSIDEKGKKLDDIVRAEETTDQKRQQSEDYLISILELEDRVRFSTIELEMYQRQEVRREMVANEKNIDAYEPGLHIKIWEAVKTGWSVLEAILLFFVRIWGVFALAAVAYFVYRFIMQKGRR